MKPLATMMAGAAALLLAGCAMAPLTAVPAEYEPATVDQYRLTSGDVVRIVVYNQQDLSNTYTVDQGGYIALPLIGRISARGKTTQALAGQIAGALQAGFLKDPDVSIEIDRYRPFFIMGEVAAGGQYSFVPGLTVQQAIAVAGGYTPRAARLWIEVARQWDGKIVTLQLRGTDAVFPGDTITIHERLL